MKTTVQNTDVRTSKKYSFSYFRFSSDPQKDGSSIPRQSEAVQQALADHPEWTYEDTWNIGSTTKGYSAYKKANFPVLMALVDAAKSGRIPKGTVCIIEQINRLTRAEIDEAEDLIKAILRSGIEIYVCKSKRLYTAANLKNLTDVILMLVDLSEANAYSAQISHNVSKAWKIRRDRLANGEVIMRTKIGNIRRDCPAWITNTGNAFELNKVAETVQDIFNLYLSGTGTAAITRKFNKENLPSLGGKVGKWSQPVIYRILSDRRVLGEIKANDQTVKGYYPAAIDSDTFDRVQAKLDDNRGKPTTGQWDKTKGAYKPIVNICSGVARCRCGSLLKVCNSHREKFLTCYGRLNGLGCHDRMTQYQPFEDAFLNILKLNPAQLVQNEDGEGANIKMQILKGRLAEVEKGIANITAMVIKGLASEALVNAQIDLEHQAEELKSQIALDAAKKTAVTGGAERLAEIQAELYNIKKDQALRARVQGWVRENCNTITLDRTKKEFTVDLKNGKLITMTLGGNILGSKSVTALFGMTAPTVQAAATA